VSMPGKEGQSPTQGAACSKNLGGRLANSGTIWAAPSSINMDMEHLETTTCEFGARFRFLKLLLVVIIVSCMSEGHIYI
jgi:hypothetical protein